MRSTMEKEKVLVVDDSASSRARTVNLLQQSVYCVFELPSPIGATRSILRNGVGVAIVDVSANAASSGKLVAALRCTPRLAEVVLLLIGPADEATLGLLERTEGVDAVLSEREVPGSLLPALHYALLRRRLGRSLELIPGVIA